MQFLDQPIEFSVQPKQPLLTATALLDAHDGARHWRAFCKAAHSAERRLIALWASDERDKNPAFGYAIHMAFDLIALDHNKRFYFLFFLYLYLFQTVVVWQIQSLYLLIIPKIDFYILHPIICLEIYLSFLT